MILPFPLPCHHTFCYTCIKAHATLNPTCPLCRAPLDVSSLRSAELETTPDQMPLWYYASRDGSTWWSYEPDTASFIEEAYQLYQKDDRFSVCRIFVSSRSYIIDFVALTQTPDKDPVSAPRPIKRFEDAMSDLVRGIAGWHLKGKTPKAKPAAPVIGSSDEETSSDDE